MKRFLSRIGFRYNTRRGRRVAMAELQDDIATYAELRADLESDSLGKWVLIHNRILEGQFDSFDAAAKAAVHRFGRGPYLIRQVGAGSVTLPASVMYRPVYADS